MQLLDSKPSLFGWARIFLMVIGLYAFMIGLLYFLESGYGHPYGGYIHFSTLSSFVNFFALVIVFTAVSIRKERRKLDALIELLRRSDIIS